MKLNRGTLVEIKGDASVRKFFRKTQKLESSILIYSKKEKEKNLLIYDAINKILLKNKINAPRLINEFYDKNFIEVQDLGKITILNLIQREKNKFLIYKKVIELLIKIQKIKEKKIRNFKKKNYNIPLYSNQLLFKESKLFCDWYIPEKIKKNKVNIKKKVENEIKYLLKNLKLKNNIFVHRDFHLSNLMINKKGISVIDSQDAAIGNQAYDLASVIDDVRYKTSNALKKNIYNCYIKKNSNKFKIEDFKNDFEILSVLRNLKIIGIFTRLAKQDKKNKYLKLIPYAWKLINLRCNENQKLKNLKIILDKFFKKKRYKYEY